MSQMIVNDSIPIEGMLTVNRALDYTEAQPKMIVQGALKTEEYIEEIDTIETDRLIILGVSVYQESFGSEEDNIIYTFTATKLVIKD